MLIMSSLSKIVINIEDANFLFFNKFRVQYQSRIYIFIKDNEKIIRLKRYTR
jgi:hypothetical protein